MNPETRYLQHLDSIERIAAFVARRNHLNADDTRDFAQNVNCKLIEDDYAIIRKFEERSSFTTYLMTVILRLFHQWRVEMWGKWRPSAEARRLGDKAITLERLITRDGFTFAEAVNVLTTRAGGVYTVAELEALYIRLPTRNPRPVLVSEEVTPDVAGDSAADDRIESRERERTARKCAEALDAALANLDAEDRLILKLRYWDSKKAPEIAQILGIEQKKVYKRLEKLAKVLRKELERAGVMRADVDQLLGSGDHEIKVGGASSLESPSFRPSDKRGKTRGGNRRVR